ncbi:hypothetical protein EAH68_08130 [Corynebacterium hylobatis]|uniref:Galactosyltransferase C-terminal domain-containing protein n=2 Tax=Corynebacterium hylobatis TaxID=1859290 RepID=A0A430HYA4_9CORY|nr:hypothetical protein EAH68_08130 [Corynebacterium hylobatis]
MTWLGAGRWPGHTGIVSDWREALLEAVVADDGSSLQRSDETSWRFIISAVLTCSRSFFGEFGGFDPTLAGYGGEDWEFGFRAGHAEARFVHEPRVRPATRGERIRILLRSAVVPVRPVTDLVEQICTAGGEAKLLVVGEAVASARTRRREALGGRRVGDRKTPHHEGTGRNRPDYCSGRTGAIPVRS